MKEFDPSVTGLREARSQLEPKAAPVAIAPPPSASKSTSGIPTTSSSRRRRAACRRRRSTRRLREVAGAAAALRRPRSGLIEDPSRPEPLVNAQAELVLEPARGVVVLRKRADRDE